MECEKYQINQLCRSCRIVDIALSLESKFGSYKYLHSVMFVVTDIQTQIDLLIYLVMIIASICKA